MINQLYTNMYTEVWYTNKRNLIFVVSLDKLELSKTVTLG